TAILTYTVADPDGGSTSKTFTLNVSNTPPNKPPSITLPFSEVTQPEDTIITVTPILVSDPDAVSFNDLVVTAHSDNQAIISDANGLVPSGAGGSRTLIIIPNPDANGVVNVTVTVTDAGDINGFNKKADSKVLKVTITPVEDQPVIILTGSTT